MEKVLYIHTDGGARGNPGPAASAFIVEEEKLVLAKGTKFLGKTTNNYAEYYAVFLATTWIKENFKKEHYVYKFLLDSELVVKQIKGEYKIKNEELKKLYVLIKELLAGLKGNFTFIHVPREKNKEADRLVNEAIDLS